MFFMNNCGRNSIAHSFLNPSARHEVDPPRPLGEVCELRVLCSSELWSREEGAGRARLTPTSVESGWSSETASAWVRLCHPRPGPGPSSTPCHHFQWMEQDRSPFIALQMIRLESGNKCFSVFVGTSLKETNAVASAWGEMGKVCWLRKLRRNLIYCLRKGIAK